MVAAAAAVPAVTTLLLLLACSGAPAQQARPAAEQPGHEARSLAFKGLELYGWPGEKGEWVFAILAGTNRRKFLSEVKSEPLSREQVRAEIAKMPELETLSWTRVAIDDAGGKGENAYLPVPPPELVEELAALARSRGVRFGEPSREAQPGY